MTVFKSSKLLLMTIILVSLVTAMLIASLAWFTTKTESVNNLPSITTSTQAPLLFEIPEEHSTEELYYGQTGTSFAGVDRPYVVTYQGVKAYAGSDMDDEMYITGAIRFVKVTLTERDPETGEFITEEYSYWGDADQQKMLGSFTWRLTLKSKSIDGVVTDYNIRYRPQNEYLVTDTSDEEPFLVEPGATYTFDLELIFQSEEGYSLLQSTRQDIGGEYIVPISDIKYMFSHIQVAFNAGVQGLFTLTFDPNPVSAGDNVVVNPSSIETSGSATITNLPTTAYRGDAPETRNGVSSDDQYYLDGWYITQPTYGEEYTDKFTPDYFISNPMKTNTSLYAGWKQNPKVTFMSEGIRYLSVYKKVNSTVTMPDAAPRGAFLCWTTQSNTSMINLDNYESYAFDFTTPITGDLVLYAAYYESVTVTINLAQDTTLGRTYIGSLAHLVGVDPLATVDYNSSTNSCTITIPKGHSLTDYFTESQLTPIILQTADEFRFFATEGGASLYTSVLTKRVDVSISINESTTWWAYYS